MKKSLLVAAGFYGSRRISRRPYRRPLHLEALERRELLATIASDGFESGNFTGGTGFSGNWTAAGDAAVLSSSSPHSGTYHARLRSMSAA